MTRIDLCAMVEQATFAPEVWEWLDLLGDVILVTQEEGLRHEDEVSSTQDRILLVLGTQRSISTVASIYILLRFELIDHAASQLRSLGEGLITLSYVMKNPDQHVPRFKNYQIVEAYEHARHLLDLEGDRAKPEASDGLRRFLSTQQEAYDRVKPDYTFTAKRGKEKGKAKAFKNWCNKGLSDQARECGADMERIYRLLYRQMSSYVHWSAFSLRRHAAYSRANYDPKVIYTDIATIVRLTVVVWLDLVRFLEKHLAWNLGSAPPRIAREVDELDAKYASKKKVFHDRP